VSTSDSPHSTPHGPQQQLADYAMIFDMLGLLTGITKEDAAIAKSWRSSPCFLRRASLIYLSMKDGKELDIRTDPSTFKIDDDMKKRL
jgi:hypothetical protein